MELMNFSKKDVTMTSLEIADLTKKLHKNVLRDIEKMFLDLEKDRLSYEHIFLDSYKREQKVYLLPKNLVLCLVTGYSVRLRMILIERLEQLEQEYTNRKEIRQLGKVTRRSLTDAIKDSGENERMHGHAYSTYTRMIQKKTKIKQKRDKLNSKQLELLECYEDLATISLKIGKIYKEIVDFLPEQNDEY